MTKYLLRDATPNDYQFLFDLLKVSMYLYYKETFGYWDDKEERNFLMESLEESTYQIIIVDGVDVGCLAIKTEKNSLFLDEIQISPETQGQGIGSQILKELIKRAEEENLILKLEVLKSNSKALLLYQRNGFVSDGENKTHFKLKLNLRTKEDQ